MRIPIGFPLTTRDDRMRAAGVAALHGMFRHWEQEFRFTADFC
jgi:hypothetical protein